MEALICELLGYGWIITIVWGVMYGMIFCATGDLKRKFRRKTKDEKIIEWINRQPKRKFH